jgi:chromosome segregation ATPase
MRRLIARVVSPRVRWLEQDRERMEQLALAEIRRLSGQLDQARATALDAEQRLALARAEVDEARRQLDQVTRATVPLDWTGEQWRREALQLRRTCAAMSDRLARYEGRPTQEQLPPMRTVPMERARIADALTAVMRQVPGDATAVLDQDRTEVIPAVRDA